MLATKQFPKAKHTKEMMFPVRLNLTVYLKHRECGLELRAEHLRAANHTTTVGAARVSNESPVLETAITPVGVSAVLPVQALVSKSKSAFCIKNSQGRYQDERDKRASAPVKSKSLLRNLGSHKVEADVGAESGVVWLLLIHQSHLILSELLHFLL
jgi:hypothetical protein